MPITALRTAVRRGRRAALATVIAAAALSVAACQDDGTGVEPIPESQSPYGHTAPSASGSPDAGPSATTASSATAP